jgi:hypothetical protein
MTTHIAKPPSTVGGILDFCRLAAIFTRLRPSGLLYLVGFAGENPCDAYTDLATLHPPIATEWDRLAAEYIHKTCCSFHRCLEVVMVKNIAFIE